MEIIIGKDIVIKSLGIGITPILFSSFSKVISFAFVILSLLKRNSYYSITKFILQCIP